MKTITLCFNLYLSKYIFIEVDDISHVKKHLDSFIEKKKTKKNLTIKLAREIAELKRLDNHIKEFSKMVDKDLKEGNKDVFKHAKNFEKAMHSELDELFKITHEDLDLYMSILKNLNDYKTKIQKKTGSNQFGLTKVEMGYAKMNIEQIKDKLKTLKKIFKDLR